jgi:hypothetical protein
MNILVEIARLLIEAEIERQKRIAAALTDSETTNAAEQIAQVVSDERTVNRARKLHY